jgi:hypothetical protein
METIMIIARISLESNVDYPHTGDSPATPTLLERHQPLTGHAGQACSPLSVTLNCGLPHVDASTLQSRENARDVPSHIACTRRVCTALQARWELTYNGGDMCGYTAYPGRWPLGLLASPETDGLRERESQTISPPQDNNDLDGWDQTDLDDPSGWTNGDYVITNGLRDLFGGDK